MKFSAAAVLALAAAVSAQKIGACDGKAQKCIDDAMVGTCDAGDYVCACANMSDLQPKATGCVLTACGSAEGAIAVIGEVRTMCENIGTEEPPAEETTAAEPPAEETSSAAEPPAEETSSAAEPPTETDVEEPPTETETPCDAGCGGGDDDDEEEPPTESGDGQTPEPTETFAPGAAGAIAPIGALVAGLFALAL